MFFVIVIALASVNVALAVPSVALWSTGDWRRAVGDRGRATGLGLRLELGLGGGRRAWA